MNGRNRWRIWKRPLVVALICLATAAGAWAQTGTSTLVGTVVDGTGAIVPGATINVTHVATGNVRTATSNETGLFRNSRAGSRAIFAAPRAGGLQVGHDDGNKPGQLGNA